MQRTERVRRLRTREDGFSLIEVLMVLVLLSIVLGIGAQGMQSFNEAGTVDRAANAVAADVTLTRSYAVQRLSEVRLVADEASRRYAIVDVGASSDDTLLTRSFSASADLPLTRLDVMTTGDHLAFNPRGMLVTGGTVGTDTVEVERLGSGRRVVISPLGRTRMEVLP